MHPVVALELLDWQVFLNISLHTIIHFSFHRRIGPAAHTKRKKCLITMRSTVRDDHGNDLPSSYQLPTRGSWFRLSHELGPKFSCPSRKNFPACLKKFHRGLIPWIRKLLSPFNAEGTEKKQIEPVPHSRQSFD